MLVILLQWDHALQESHLRQTKFCLWLVQWFLGKITIFHYSNYCMTDKKVSDRELMCLKFVSRKVIHFVLGEHPSLISEFPSGIF